MNDKTNVVVRAKNGEKEAFEQLYVATKDKVYFLCLKFMKNEADAMDIVSDTYLTVIEKLNTLNQPEYFETWVKKIAANKCKNYLAKSKAVLFSEQEDMERYADDLPEWNDEFIPESYVENSEKRKQIMDIIENELSDVQRSVILMYYYAESSVRDIAGDMGCSEGTVKSRLNSARNVIYKYVMDKQKKGETLFSMGSVPLLSLLLQEAAKDYIVSEEQSALILGKCMTEYEKLFNINEGTPMNGNDLTEQAGNLSQKALEKGVSGAVKKTIATKIAIAVAGVAIAGATVTGIYITKNNRTKQDTYVENQQKVTESSGNTVNTDADQTEEKALTTETMVSEKMSAYTYPLEVKSGETVEIDLDGDGILDKIMLDIKTKNRDDSSNIDEYAVFKINDFVENTEYENYGCPRLFITDINDKDNKKEICLIEPYANDILDYYFYSYSNDKGIKRTDTLSGYDIQFTGNGNVLCTERTMASVTMLFVDFEYIYNEDKKFELVDRVYTSDKDFAEMNELFYGKETILTLKKELEIYKDCSESGGMIKIKPQKLKVSALRLSDGFGSNVWVQVELEDKSTGWLYGNYGFDYEENEFFDGIGFAG